MNSNPPLRVVIADDDPVGRKYLETVLPQQGHQVAFVATSGQQLVDHCKNSRPDLVITDIQMPDMDGIQAAAEICRDGLIPVILVSSYFGPELVERAKAEHILGYLVKPIKQPDLMTAINLAMWRFEQFQTLRKEAINLRQALEDRKIIERAKGLIMKRVHADEQEAFRRMQKLASNKNRKLIDIAHMILVAEEALDEHSS